MKTKKPVRPVEKPASFSLRPWHVVAGALAALVILIEVYGPALHGLFVFDDEYLPFYSYDLGTKPLSAVVQGVRPLLMVTFWLNHRLSQLEPYSYHLLNVLLHFGGGFLVFLISLKFLEWAGVENGRRQILAAFAGGVFLLHPVQTESVAYVASRSENLSVLLCYAAFAVFLYRRKKAASWATTACVLVLFAAAASTKEHTVVLPALLLLTDYYWNPGFSFEGIRKNWRLYVTMSVAGAAGVLFVWNVLRSARTAGFGMEGLTWNEYFYTQWRALWVYFRLFLFPAGQNGDYDYPFSRTPLDHGAIIGLIGLLVLVGLAFRFRKRFPLASYGFFAALVLFAPTSSIVPIQDAVAERRIYLPMIGLILVVLELLRRWKIPFARLAGVLAGVLLVLGFLTYQRNKVWAGPIPFWENVLAGSPDNSRAHFQIGLAYYQEGRCEAAVSHYARSEKLGRIEHRLFVDWALAEDCLGHPEQALAHLERAAGMRPTAHVYALIGMIHAKQGHNEQALAALNQAERLDPAHDMTYAYRGNILLLDGDAAGAAVQYRRALELNPNNEAARNGLARATSASRKAP